MSLSKITIIALVTLLFKVGLTVHQPPPSNLVEQVAKLVSNGGAPHKLSMDVHRRRCADRRRYDVEDVDLSWTRPVLPLRYQHPVRPRINRLWTIRLCASSELYGATIGEYWLVFVERREWPFIAYALNTIVFVSILTLSRMRAEDAANPEVPGMNGQRKYHIL
ncbi:hypothetical protein BYT27DRAFT_7260104 [Phlegmacium glaucopus]|nr:hypothetical protein BYT27DRAFT_7260104 [Phlegmacium glaucopus]